MSPLTIYRASAGSGKTFALARDFLRLVLRVPEKYRHILAVTFTNKATAEMKSRILGELNRLAGGLDSDMRAMLEKESGLHGQELEKRAREILDSILHDYSHFHVETIDRFYQRVIRVFTREIGLAAGYRIELESDQVLSEAVDGLLHELDRDHELLSWIESYAKERVEEGRHWNLKNDILELGKEINKERYQEESAALGKVLADKGRLQAFMDEMDRMRYGFEKKLSGYALEALGIMKKEGVETGDFKHGSLKGIGGCFRRWAYGDYKKPSRTVMKSDENPEEWVSQASGAKDRVLHAYENGLGDCLSNCLQLFTDKYRSYRSAVEIKKHLYVLGILNEISDRMHAYTKEQGIFLLSDASRFLYGIIDGNEAPFIYEKTGDYFHHYMIDEFQDTSSMQWKNFLPLIDNSLAFMRDNLVVGDVKQSIYRWRNSDWEILSERIHRQFDEEQLEVRGLDRNWRSRRNIVAFNNDFFSGAVKVYSGQFGSGDGGNGSDKPGYAGKIESAYSDLAQKVPGLPGKEGGFVRIQLFDAEKGKDWKASAHRQVIETIERLQDSGLQPSDTAILVRTAKEGKQISDVLLDHKSRNPESRYKYDVISNDSLFLAGASSIRVILGVMRYLNRPDHRLNLAELLIEYHRLSPGIAEIPAADILAEGLADDRVKGFLPAAFYDMAENLKYLSLTELTGKIIQMFGLDGRPSQIPYLLAFQDIILDYLKSRPADIPSFLDWWDENGEKKVLSLSEEQNAIRVMTIHKAKGLEFGAVIIPYCNWSLDHMGGYRRPVLWCTPAEEPFSRIPLLPVLYGSGLRDTVFRKDYEDENFRIYMDHLNLLYVAMTRAQDALIAFGRKNGKAQLADVSVLLNRVLTQGAMPSCPGGTWIEETGQWILGELNFKGEPKPADEKRQSLIRQYSSHPFSGKLKLVYRGTDFFDPEAKNRIDYGNLMHGIFSMIASHSDVDRAVDRIRREGMIGREEAEKIRSEIRQILHIEPFRGWFDGSWKVIAERDILDRAGALKRPDRVMMKEDRLIVVDYKFGHTRAAAHKQQVQQYTRILRQMNYRDVEGYIWYVLLGELIKI